MDDHLVPLAGDWALRRDFAVRSAGFAVAGLDAFGAEDESGRLREIAADPAFREAVTWQNRGALATAADGLLKDGVKPSKRRQREEVVARYWQRYCSKNDTIGFFGPLAWGEVRDAGPALAQRSRALVRERTVHLEVWCLERFLQTVTDDPWLPLGPWPEEDARIRIGSIADAAARDRAETGLARLEAARGRIAAASRDELAPALDEFDRLFKELVGEPPARTPELAGGGRTPIYMDAMRDLDVDLGPGLVAELAASLAPLLESSRWLCGRSFELGCGLMMEAVGSGGPRPLAPLFGKVFAALREMPRLLAPEHDELQRRWAELLEDPDRATIGDRARARFSDYGPAWPISVFHSPDIQIAAADVEAVRAGRVPNRDRRLPPGHEPARAGRLLLPSPRPAAVPRDLGLGRRHADDLPLAAAGAAGPDDRAVDAGGEHSRRHRRPAADARGARAPGLAGRLGRRPAGRRRHDHGPRGLLSGTAPRPLLGTDVRRDRVQLRTVPESRPHGADHGGAHRVPPRELADLGRRLPDRSGRGSCLGPRSRDATASLRAHARRAQADLPRHGEPDPRSYLLPPDPTACRSTGRARGGVGELPRPEDCWLELDGERYTSELRLAAVDLTRRGHAKIEVGCLAMSPRPASELLG